MKRYIKGTLTVEASLVCPVFIYVLLIFIYIISWFQSAVKLQAEMTEQARFAAGAAIAVTNAEAADKAEDIIIFRRLKTGVLPIRTNHKTIMRPYVGISTIGGDKEDPIVYVTSKGAVYHTDRSCSYIKIAYKEISAAEVEYKRNRSGGKYKPCETCCRNNTASAGNVYITDYGDRYHTSCNCSRLYRNVMAIRLSEVSDMRKCSKCDRK